MKGLPRDGDGRSPSPTPATSGFWRSRAGISLIVFLAIGGFLLAVEHRAHILSSEGLLLGLLVGCLALHLFMHGGHGGGRGGGAA